MPKASIDEAKELAKLSSDCSFLLTHLIRHPDRDAKMIHTISFFTILSQLNAIPLLT
jgi:hypothetical protein